MPRRGRGGKPPSGRYRFPDKKKRKNNRSRRPTTNQAGDQLMDLEQNVYIPEMGISAPVGSMRSVRQRRFFAEANYTGEHMEATVAQPLRKRPIEFVKAKEVYDPQQELRRLMNRTPPGLTNPESKAIENQEPVAIEQAPSPPESQMGDEQIASESESPEDKAKAPTEEQVPELQDSPLLEAEAFVEAQDIHSADHISNQMAEVVIDDEGDPSLAHARASTKSILTPSNLEHDPVLTIGKISLHTDNGIATARMARGPSQLPEHRHEPDSDSDSGYKDYIQNVLESAAKDFSDEDEYESDTNFDIMAESSDEEEEEPEDSEEDGDPEYGFAEEDFEFDVSRLAITNVRFGVKNQYYVRNDELAGSHSDSVWVDEDDLHEYVILQGVKPHRLASFMKYMTKELIDEEPDYSDVYISSDESVQEEEPEDDDGLADIIAFTKQQHQQQRHPFEVEPTHALRTKGKGKNKRLDLDEFDLDLDIKAALQEQYLANRQQKKDKKDRKNQKRLDQAELKRDLLVLYEHTMHVKDFKEEMEMFYHDFTRDVLSFPPLDPHGNKTVTKMAGCYNFKTTREGLGLKVHIKVTKNRKTFQYLPRYDQIGAILKQRPIFPRADVKRPRKEIVSTDGNLDKDRRRGRGKDQSKAYVREGDVVGSEAPEIDASNIGRQLLEKLGWVKGEGLGALGNKGISEPLTATVKKSKRGLGIAKADD